LTAVLAEKGTATIIDETEGGWFRLPPLSLWESWASEGLKSAEKRMAEGKFHSGPTVDSVAPKDLSEF
jgi:hypothetical protein